VITGFNTDIEFDGTVYHVQTEDKGLSARMVMSLVYDGGTILASKRVRYDDLVTGDFDKKELAAQVSRQHKLICAAVRAGRIAELKEMTARSNSAGTKAMTEANTAVAESTVPAAPINVARVRVERVIRVTPHDPLPVEPVVEDARIIEEPEILFAEVVEVVSELSGQERPSNTKLSLELLGDTKFKGGDRSTVNIMVCRGTDRKVVRDAQIMIKVLGSTFRPVIFHARSDSNGLAKVHLQLPHFQAGRAALLVRAISSGEEIELRRIVTPG
jgi:hypothetical protein